MAFRQKKWTKQIIKQYLNKKIIMTNEDEEIYKQTRIKHRYSER